MADIILVRQGRAILISVVGELDLVRASTLERRLRVVEGGCDPLVLDLRAVTFFDSSGMRVVLEAHDRARAGGWRLAVLNGAGAVDRLFILVGVEETLALVRSPEALDLGGGVAAIAGR